MCSDGVWAHGATVQRWGPATPSIHGDPRVPPWAHSLSRHRIRTCAHTQHVTGTRAPLSVAPLPPTVLRQAGPLGIHKNLSGVTRAELGENLLTDPQACFSFLKWTCLRESSWFLFPTSPLQAGKRPSSLFCVSSTPSPGVWRPPGCHADWTLHRCWACEAGEHSREGVSTNPLGVFPPGHKPVAKCQALSLPAGVTVYRLSLI